MTGKWGHNSFSFWTVWQNRLLRRPWKPPGHPFWTLFRKKGRRGSWIWDGTGKTLPPNPVFFDCADLPKWRGSIPVHFSCMGHSIPTCGLTEPKNGSGFSIRRRSLTVASRLTSKTSRRILSGVRFSLSHRPGEGDSIIFPSGGIRETLSVFWPLIRQTAVRQGSPLPRVGERSFPTKDCRRSWCPMRSPACRREPVTIAYGPGAWENGNQGE